MSNQENEKVQIDCAPIETNKTDNSFLFVFPNGGAIHKDNVAYACQKYFEEARHEGSGAIPLTWPELIEDLSLWLQYHPDTAPAFENRDWNGSEVCK